MSSSLGYGVYICQEAANGLLLGILCINLQKLGIEDTLATPPVAGHMELEGLESLTSKKRILDPYY